MNKDLIGQLYAKSAQPLIRLILRLGISPQQVTLGRFIFLMPVIFILLSTGSYVNGVISLVFYHVFKVLDFIDGEIARIKSLPPPKPLDPIIDNLSTSLIIIGIALGLLNTNNAGQILGFHADFSTIMMVGFSALLGQIMCSYLTLEMINASMLYTNSKGAERELFKLNSTTMNRFTSNIILLPTFPYIFIFSYGYIINVGIITNNLFAILITIAIFHNLRWVVMLYALSSGAKTYSEKNKIPRQVIKSDYPRTT